MAAQVVTGFVHREGNHCESTVMRDLMEHAGVNLSEAMVFGLDATMGFAFFDLTGKANSIAFGSEPIFLGGKQGTITADSLACRILGMKIKCTTNASADDAWSVVKDTIIKGNPVGIQLDMYYLPYFKEKFHFGGHWVTLAGFDEDADIGLVFDRDLAELQEVGVDALKSARSSHFGTKYLHPENKSIVITLREDGKKPPFARAVKLATQQVAKNMIATSLNFQGIKGLRLLAKSIAEWPTKIATEKAKSLFLSLTGFIEDYGTGGGLFRKMYAEFLDELADHEEIDAGPFAWKQQELDLLHDASGKIKEASVRWTEFASVLKQVVDEHGDACLEQLDCNTLVNIIESIIDIENDGFKTLSKITL
ncbi:MAG TPA: BtrH N-terminal domain-containing protein [Candidatus Lokiarchaeia archaeon]|nr:BtrH N-terminal domain-containing protein [Candidatus Lokiarchaeia archaeon]